MRTTSLLPALTLTFGMAFLGQPSDVLAGGCEKDTDCKGDRVCDNGNCVAPGGATAPPPAAGCTKDTDCQAGAYCVSGACVTESGQPPAAGTGQAPAGYGTQPPATGTAQPPPAGGTPPAAGYGAQPPPGYDAPPPPPGPGGYAQPGSSGLAPPPAMEMERRSVGLMVGGIIGAGVGGLATIGGIIGTVVSTNDSSTACVIYDDCDESPEPAAIGVLIGGAVFLITGLVFTFIGGAQVPVEAEQPAQAYVLEPTPDGLRLRF